MKYEEFLEQLECFLNESGMTQKELSKESEVPESQISEWLNRRRGSRVGGNAQRIIALMKKYFQKGNIPIPKDVEKTVRRVWNGDPKRAQVIIKMLNSIESAFE